MPHPDQVEFFVSQHKKNLAHHRAYIDKSGHEISVSARNVKDLDLLNRCMAHEMVHLRQDQLRMRDQHGAGFKRLAKLVCRRHSWDFASF